MPIKANTPVPNSRVHNTASSRRNAVSLDFSNARVNWGTKAALMAPSAKRSRNKLGMRNAILNASATSEAPKRNAKTCSRTRPPMRLKKVATPMAPACFATEAWG